MRSTHFCCVLFSLLAALALGLRVSAFAADETQRIKSPPQSPGAKSHSGSPNAAPARAKISPQGIPGLDPYLIEPPDVISIELDRFTPNDRGAMSDLKPRDVVHVMVVPNGAGGGNPLEALGASLELDRDGDLDLGPLLGKCHVAGRTPSAAADIVQAALRRLVTAPAVFVVLQKPAHIRGEHVVNADGKIDLGRYGCVDVAGADVEGARRAVEKHLSKYDEDVRLSVEIYARNSKVYYVIEERGQRGDFILRCPCTGNESLAHAIVEAGGLKPSHKDVWIARPAPGGTGPDQILPFDLTSINRTATECQLLPGDRVFMSADARGSQQETETR